MEFLQRGVGVAEEDLPIFLIYTHSPMGEHHVSARIVEPRNLRLGKPSNLWNRTKSGAAAWCCLGLPMHTDTVAAVFTCTHCNAVPEQVVDGKATIAIVRHKRGCPTLMAQTRTRWPAHQ
jgi:hypothetical protein